MGSLSGLLHRPVLAASALAIASVSADCFDKSHIFKSSSSNQSNPPSPSPHSLEKPNSSWVSQITSSKLTQLPYLTRIHVPLPNIHIPIPNSYSNNHSLIPPPSLVLLPSYQSAHLSKYANTSAYSYSKSQPSSNSDVLYRWHLPDPTSINVPGGDSSCSRTVVVLLGWLGAKQKHLNRYAEWYTSRGYHVITFTFPMSEVLGYRIGGKAEKDVELLVDHLGEWLEEEHGKNLVFHTFSNTGWLTYGVVLEKFQRKDSDLTGRIRGCIVDSAPVDAPDPQVFASGFSAAFLKKSSVATKGSVVETEVDGTRTCVAVKPGLGEAALLLILEKLFGVVLSYPSINRRLYDLVSLLTSEQPRCPQLYIYSSADRVIPAGYVESFIEKQRKSGRDVRACNFISTPHVDHFRNDPNLYSSQLTQFMEDCVLTTCKSPS